MVGAVDGAPCAADLAAYLADGGNDAHGVQNRIERVAGFDGQVDLIDAAEFTVEVDRNQGRVPRGDDDAA